MFFEMKIPDMFFLSIFRYVFLLMSFYSSLVFYASTPLTKSSTKTQMPFKAISNYLTCVDFLVIHLESLSFLSL